MPRIKPNLERYVVFLVDGISAETFNELLNQGNLPTLQRYVKQGAYHDNVVASFPTVTGPGHIPLFSGINPASIDFVGHNQFHRSNGKLENYLLSYNLFSKKYGDRKTLYHQFDNSVSISEPFRVGATTYRKNIFALADWAKIRGPANWYVMRTVLYEYRAGRDLIIGWLHETDALAHLSPNKQKVEKSLIDLDRYLLKFEKEMDDNTTIVLCSDHGMERTDGVPFSLKNELRKLGYGLTSNRLFLDGGGFGQIYFKKDGTYKERLDESFLGALPGTLAERDAVDLTIYRRGQGAEMRAVVQSKKGVGVITKNESKYCYKLEKGTDPLGIVNPQNKDQLAEGSDRQKCITISGSTNYPDSLFQVYELLKAPSSGDLLITSAPGKGFNLLTRFAVHGGLNRKQAVTFMLFNKPMQGLEAEALTTADLPDLISKNRVP